MSLEDLLAKVKRYQPTADLALIRKAYQFADEAHQGQLRESGEPFITHPLAVAQILADLELDDTTIVAGLLHDVVEDTPVQLAQIEKEFGPEIALLVNGVTKLGRITTKTNEDQQAENLRKMFLAMAEDIRVILIKLADRLHNMRTLKYRPPQKQKKTAKETLEIFAPLAHRLGISKLKWELEDLAFRYLEPENYYSLVDKVAKKRQDREEDINKVIEVLRAKLSEVGIMADIEGRPKHFYSIYKKMVSKGKNFAEIYDITAVRVLVDSVKDCYGVLGVVHTLWRPLPGRFKDYIATPKPNMYQSLHTTVVGPQGEPLEIQIRTWDMHRTAEYGIAAHWRYKEGHFDDPQLEKKLSWLRGMLEWQRDLKDAREFMETLKIDLFTTQVFVFTPKGDVVELPAGSVPIDFAYRIHSDIGNRCVGARVNGRIVPLDTPLKNGDIVEIITSKIANGPSRDWLNIVKSSQAKSKIRQWFKRVNREENIEKGKELLERELKKANIEFSTFEKDPELLAKITKRFNTADEEELYAAIGYGGLTATQVAVKIAEEYGKKAKQAEATTPVQADVKTRRDKRALQGISVRGEENVLVRFARCCNPVPGDPIVGYVTKGAGVSVHRADCPNISRLPQVERMIDVTWVGEAQGTFPVDIAVYAYDRPKLLTDIINLLTESKTPINAVNARTTANRSATIDLTVEIKNLEHLRYIMDKIRKVKDVYSVERLVVHRNTV